MKTAIKVLGGAALGFLALVVLVPDQKTRAMQADLRLGEYAKLRPENRRARIDAAARAAGAVSEIDHYITCMGEFAKEKDPDLLVNEVFGWCDQERRNAPDRFRAHFNSLDAKNLAGEATAICKEIIKTKLISPSSAKFPLGTQAADRSRHRYTLVSYVDSQNGFGAMVRTNFRCDLKYKGSGDTLSMQSWTVNGLEFTPI